MLDRIGVEGAIPATVHLKPRQHVLPGGQAVMKVMSLKNETETAPQCQLRCLTRAVELSPKQAHAATLHVAQAAHERQECCLS